MSSTTLSNFTNPNGDILGTTAVTFGNNLINLISSTNSAIIDDEYAAATLERTNNLYTSISYAKNPHALTAAAMAASVLTETIEQPPGTSLTKLYAKFNTLETVADISAGGTITATGLITANGGITADGGITANGGITADGGITVNNGLIDANGGITATGLITANGGITTNGTINASGTINATGTVTVPDPSNDTDAATKKYVDDLTYVNLVWLEPVAAYAATPINLAVPNTVIDTYTLQLNDRVLVNGQGESKENGIYVYNNTDPNVNYLTRATDFDDPNELNKNVAVFVINGTKYANTAHVCNALGSTFALNTDAINFYQFSRIQNVNTGASLKVDAADGKIDINISQINRSGGSQSDSIGTTSSLDTILNDIYAKLRIIDSSLQKQAANIEIINNAGVTDPIPTQTLNFNF